MNELDIIIFSKDRPAQLFALLESANLKCKDFNYYKISVIYKESEEFNGIYKDIINTYSNINFIKEQNFYTDFSKKFIFSNSKYVMFLVDDIIFKETFEIKNCLNFLNNNQDYFSFSLRLGKNIDYCYPASCKMQFPEFINFNNEIIGWDVNSSEYDWNYVFSLDGNIYRSEIFKEICFSKYVNVFNSPNKMESNLSLIKFNNLNICCFEKSKIVNIPDNRVQEEFQNKNEGSDFREIINKWNNFYKIDIDKIFEIQNNSCHFPVKFNFIKRK